MTIAFRDIERVVFRPEAGEQPGRGQTWCRRGDWVVALPRGSVLFNVVGTTTTSRHQTSYHVSLEPRGVSLS